MRHANIRADDDMDGEKLARHLLDTAQSLHTLRTTQSPLIIGGSVEKDGWYLIQLSHETNSGMQFGNLHKLDTDTTIPELTYDEIWDIIQYFHGDRCRMRYTYKYITRKYIAL